jgi:hypothetical protein
MAVDILLAGEYPNDQEMTAIEDMTLDPELLEMLRLYGIEEQWDETLPQRVLAYEEHFARVKQWLDEWPNMVEHIGLMQLGDDGPNTEILSAGLGQLAHSLGFDMRAPRQRSGNRPVNDQVIKWRKEAVIGWYHHWADIEALIYLLHPQIAQSVVSALSTLLGTIPLTLEAATEYYRARREAAAIKHKILMETTNNPPSA